MPNYLGIEIGGTKIQVGVGNGERGSLLALRRGNVDPTRGAAGIRDVILQWGRELLAEYSVSGVGIAFGGPVDCSSGRAIKSHHVSGWDGFPLVDWCSESFGLPAALANDADLAGLAEARLGAGQGARVVFYITVGTGIGGALILDGSIYSGSTGIASELGHLRPGPAAEEAIDILEARSAGWGIARRARCAVESLLRHGATTKAAQSLPVQPISGEDPVIASDDREPTDCGDLVHAAEALWEKCGRDRQRLTAQAVAEAASQGNPLAGWILAQATRDLGWGVAQMITLLAPEKIVIGGGVSLMGESLFFRPLRQWVARYVFPPLADAYEIVPAALGEEVMIHGALVLARDTLPPTDS